jgi:anaerobic magnesium-protoporphyrin IX monomethyl ester cyclase
MDRKIILINPQANNKNTSVPLSLAYLGAQLLAFGYNVKVIDASAPYNPVSNEDILRSVNEFKPDAICVTIMTPFAREAYDLIRCMKTDHPFIIAGGAHATILPAEVLQIGADVVIRGEGEATLVELLKTYFNGNSLETVKGISFNTTGGIIHNPNREFIGNLDLLPPPAKNLFDPGWYDNSGKPTNESFGSIITSRGCPGRCTFCSRAVFSNKMRYNSPEYIISQMLFLHENNGINRFYFLDDNFTTNKIRLSSICGLIKNNLPEATWACTSRIDNVNYDALKMMKDSGCTTITYGLESGSNRTLQSVNKKLTVDKIISVVKMTYDLGFDVCANWILGFPTETREDVEDTIKLVELLNPYIAMHNAGFLIPFPGTEIYEQYKYLDSVKEYWLK